MRSRRKCEDEMTFHYPLLRCCDMGPTERALTTRAQQPTNHDRTKDGCPAGYPRLLHRLLQRKQSLR
jgi:hypothetical protein